MIPDSAVVSPVQTTAPNLIGIGEEVRQAAAKFEAQVLVGTAASFCGG
jgi:hypothetical protein